MPTSRNSGGGRRRHRALPLSRAVPRGQRDNLEKSIHSTSAHCFQSWRGGFIAVPCVGSENGNRSAALSAFFTMRSSFRPSPDRLMASFDKPGRSGARDCLPENNVWLISGGRTRDVEFWIFFMLSRPPQGLALRFCQVLLHCGGGMISSAPPRSSHVSWCCRTVVRVLLCEGSSILGRYVTSRRRILQGCSADASVFFTDIVRMLHLLAPYYVKFGVYSGRAGVLTCSAMTLLILRRGLTLRPVSFVLHRVLVTGSMA